METSTIIRGVLKTSLFSRFPSNKMPYKEGRIYGYQRFASMTNGLPGTRDNKWPQKDNDANTSLFVISNRCTGLDRP
jgi:hypothetical protein